MLAGLGGRLEVERAGLGRGVGRGPVPGIAAVGAEAGPGGRRVVEPDGRVGRRWWWWRRSDQPGVIPGGAAAVEGEGHAGDLGAVEADRGGGDGQLHPAAGCGEWADVLSADGAVGAPGDVVGARVGAMFPAPGRGLPLKHDFLRRVGGIEPDVGKKGIAGVDREGRGGVAVEVELGARRSGRTTGGRASRTGAWGWTRPSSRNRRRRCRGWPRRAPSRRARRSCWKAAG